MALRVRQLNSSSKKGAKKHRDRVGGQEVKEVLFLLAAYLLGSIPVGYLVCLYFKKIDIRKFGSGNIGTTNAFRILGVGPAIGVLTGDLIKGFIPTYLAMQYTSPTIAVMVGLLAMAGHNWSVFLGFKGGRGVATGAGVVFALSPKVILIAWLIFATIIFITRYVSMGSIMGAISVPLLMLYFKEPLPILIFGIVAASFVVIRHIPNMKRLISGTEFRLGQKVSHEGRK